MNTFAVAVIGMDRPGIVAQVTGALAAHEGNIEDSSMTLLRGHFAWMLVVSLPSELAQVDASLADLRAEDLRIDILELPTNRSISAEPTHMLTVYGSDHPGIVAAVARVIADVGGNVTDLSTRLTETLYVVVAEMTLPDDIDIDAFSTRLDEVGEAVGVEIALREVVVDEC